MLLILAGITINALTGSDSAPAKANEAEQKNDIGSAKDQISLTATNAKLSAYDTAYVGNGVSSTEAATTVGQAVIDAVLPYNGKTIGKASIEVEQTIKNSKRDDATITIITRDFEIVGTITIQDGILTWGEIGTPVPGIKLSRSTLTIEPGKTGELAVLFKMIPSNTSVTWTSTDYNKKISVDNGTVSVNSRVANGTTATIRARVSFEGKDYVASCKVTAKVRQPIVGVVGDYIPYNVSYKDTYTGNIFTSTTGWRILDAEETDIAGEYKNVKIISTGIPVKYYYRYDTSYDGSSNTAISETNVPEWWGTDEQVTQLYGSTYATGFVYNDSGFPNYYATTGLFKNFSLIPLDKSGWKYNTVYVANTTSGNHAITNADYKGLTEGTTKTNDDTGYANGAIFLTNKAEEVHCLTLQELNFARGLGAVNDTKTTPKASEAEYEAGDSRLGLFYLRNLNDYGYTSDIGTYWLATPEDHGDHAYIKDVKDGNRFYSDGWGQQGVRTVVSLKSNIYIKKVNNEWKFITVSQ